VKSSKLLSSEKCCTTSWLTELKTGFFKKHGAYILYIEIGINTN
jgi:hypothetical protein